MDRIESGLLTVPEASAFLRLKTSTIRAWVLKRKVVHLKVGGRVFLRRSDLEALITASVVPAISNAPCDGFKTTGNSPPLRANKKTAPSSTSADVDAR